MSEALLQGLAPASRALLHVAAVQELVPIGMALHPPLAADPAEAVAPLCERGLLVPGEISGLYALSPMGYALRDAVLERWPMLHETLRPLLLEHLDTLDLSDTLRRALHRIDRADFLPERVRILADMDLAAPIDQEGMTTSAPHALVAILGAVKPRSAERVLICGAKGGVTLALAAHMVGREGEALALDWNPDTVGHVSASLAAYPALNASVRQQNDVTLGAPGPWSVVVVNGSVPKIPWPLVEQLGPGGRILLFLQTPDQPGQACYLLHHDGSVDHDTQLSRYCFTPIYGRYGWDRLEELRERARGGD